MKNSSPPHKPSSTCTPMIPAGCVAPSGYKRYTVGSKGDGLNESSLRALSNSWNQRKGASIKPYADFDSLQISDDDSFMALIISGGGSIPMTLPCVDPCKNAALISKDINIQFIDEISWSMSIRDWRPKVGLSLGISSSAGSKYPKTTNRALAFRLLPVLACSSMDSIGFQVYIQRHLNTCSGDSWLRKTRQTVPVLSQLEISAAFALSNSSRSAGVS